MRTEKEVNDEITKCQNRIRIAKSHELPILNSKLDALKAERLQINPLGNYSTKPDFADLFKDIFSQHQK